MKNKKDAIIIAGVTCSGKSRMALEIAKVQDAVIINCDAMQTFNTFPILSAQPSKEDFLQAEHKLYSILSCIDCYSVKNWLIDAEREIYQALYNNKTPIITGGTGMYIDSLLNGISDIPNVSNETIQEINDIIDKQGLDIAYKMLQEIDLDYANQIAPQDKQRIVRGLGIKMSTGNAITSFWQEKKRYCSDVNFNVRLINANREENYKNINNRVIEMVKNGAIEEVEKWYCKYKDKIDIFAKNTVTKTIGVEEICNFLDGKMTIEEIIEKIQQKTRNYAKRQRTWFNNKLKGTVVNF